MAGFPPKKNAAFTWYFFIRDADGDPVVGATTLDVESSGDGATFADVAGTEVDEGEGLYSCPIAAGEMDFDVVALICKTGTAGAKTAAQVIYTSTDQIDDLATPAEVNAEVVDVLKTDTVTLPGQVAPPLAPTMEQALAHLYKAYRNRKEQTATQWSLMADDESTVDQKATVSDDTTTAIKQEIISGA